MFLLGNVGQQLDIGDLERVVRDMQDEVMSTQRSDVDQDKSIALLRRENRELKLYLATVVRLLVAKGVLKAEEVETTVGVVDPKA
ncbi:MAG: hypothetical protein QM813_16365 [Verrucomicrobiota bacterium]